MSDKILLLLMVIGTAISTDIEVNNCIMSIKAINYRQVGPKDNEWKFVPLELNKDENGTIVLEAERLYEFKASFEDTDISNLTIKWSTSGVRINTNVAQITFYHAGNLLMYARADAPGCSLKDALWKIPIEIYSKNTHKRPDDPSQTSSATSSTSSPQKQTSEQIDRPFLHSPLFVVLFLFTVILLCISLAHNHFQGQISWTRFATCFNSFFTARSRSPEQIEMTHCITSKNSYG